MSHISGQSAEYLIIDAAKGFKCHPFVIDTQTQLTALRSIPAGVHRIEVAMKHLCRMFDYPEDDMPAQFLQDIAMGLDLCINYRGWFVGIDVTINPKAVDKKISQKRELIPAYRAAGLDLIIILEVTGKPTAEMLSDVVKAAIRSSEYIVYAVI
jgi:hypothetical protein